MASTYLTRTPSSAGNRKTFTISVWVKFSGDGDNVGIFNAWSADSNSGHFTFKRSSTNSSIGWSQWSLDNYSNRCIRDVNSFYHLVMAVDTTQNTASDRAKLYINGEQITSWLSSYSMGLNEELPVNNTNIHTIGINKYSSIGNYFNGSMSHFHFVDGLALAPTVFGSTDATTGEWKINTAPTISDYGTNGFFILKDGNSVTDQSGKGNNWTVGAGTLTKTEDCPDNVFATMNPLNAYYDVCTLSNGNTTYDGNSANGNYTFTPATMGFNKGKWYWEMKFGSSDSSNWGGLGIISASSTGATDYLGKDANSYGYYGRTLSGGLGVTYNNNTQTNQGLPFTNNDIIMVAVDCDNLAIYFGKNGTWLNNSSSVTGVPTSGASKTGAFFSITAPSSTTDGFYFPASGTYSGSEVYPQNLNFGNGYFGTTAVSSAGTNASDIGIFEYDVPTGYTALSTKGLNE